MQRDLALGEFLLALLGATSQSESEHSRRTVCLGHGPRKYPQLADTGDFLLHHFLPQLAAAIGRTSTPATRFAAGTHSSNSTR